MNKQVPSVPPPKQASFEVYIEQADYAIQLTPFETHFTPEIALAHKSLVVNMMSVHNLTLQVEVDVVLTQMQIPSVP